MIAGSIPHQLFLLRCTSRNSHYTQCPCIIRYRLCTYRYIACTQTITVNLGTGKYNNIFCKIRKYSNCSSYKDAIKFAIYESTDIKFYKFNLLYNNYTF